MLLPVSKLLCPSLVLVASLSQACGLEARGSSSLTASHESLGELRHLISTFKDDDDHQMKLFESGRFLNETDGDDDHEGEHEHEDEGVVTSSTLDAEEDKPWSEVIIASLLINLTTLIGVVFLSGEIISKRAGKDITQAPYYAKFTGNIIPMFACGALLATTFFLILPEALFMINGFLSGEEEAHSDHSEDGEDHRFLEGDEDHEEEEDAAAIWRFGTCILFGFLLPTITGMLFPHSDHGVLDEASTSSHATAEEVDKLNNSADSKSEEEGKDVETLAHVQKPETQLELPEEDKPKGPINYHLIASIMVGDFFHNFADGMFVGAAFLLCDRSLAITVAAATIYHEIAQEVADYFMLTRFANLTPVKALFLNFINGMSVLLGAIIVIGIEDIPDMAIGCILAVSGGVYIYISVAECIPRAKLAQKNVSDKLTGLLAFAAGAIPIGLVLLNHTHCEAAHDH